MQSASSAQADLPSSSPILKANAPEPAPRIDSRIRFAQLRRDSLFFHAAKRPGRAPPRPSPPAPAQHESPTRVELTPSKSKARRDPQDSSQRSRCRNRLSARGVSFLKTKAAPQPRRPARNPCLRGLTIDCCPSSKTRPNAPLLVLTARGCKAAAQRSGKRTPSPLSSHRKSKRRATRAFSSRSVGRPASPN